ncbi:hypothetical protein [Chitinilyticum aquatile]|uniref:hypothetical protein n=1 Tax=Chitinilyticum aquatile TaxID=362520 RepID=UPI0012DD2E0D|nr:hypothetical protein [Chitinilyticum aquatile]
MFLIASLSSLEGLTIDVSAAPAVEAARIIRRPGSFFLIADDKFRKMDAKAYAFTGLACQQNAFLA